MLSILRNPGQQDMRSADFDSLMRSSYRQAYSVAFRLTGNSTDAEDLVQDAYLRAFRFIHRYDDTLPFISWLYRILANSHIDMVRRRKNTRHSSLDAGIDGRLAMEVADETMGPEVLVMHDALSDEIQAGMNHMNPEFRMAVVLCDIEGHSYEEVAEIMETSVGTVRSRIHRGRIQLRQFLMKNYPATFGGAYDL